MSEENRLFSNEQVIRLLVGVFLIGAAWARLEVKMDQQTEKTMSVIREYIIANDKDKTAITVQMSNFKDQLDMNTLTIKAIADFIKPDEPRRKKYRE